MGTNNLLDRAAAVLDEARPAAGGSYALYVKEGQIRLCRWPALQGNEKVIARLSSNEVTYGLTSRRWNRIDDKLRQLQKEKVIE